MNTSDLNVQWLDFYALLGASPDADKETLRRTIGTTYAEASANGDHRDLSRRHYFQTMVERVLPQARRVLLDPKLREAYDEQNALHQKGDASALDYVSFMAAQQSGGAVKPGAVVRAAATPGEFDSLPEKVRDEITLARAVLECVQSGSEFDLLPAKVLSGAAAPSASDATAASDAGGASTASNTADLTDTSESRFETLAEEEEAASDTLEVEPASVERSSTADESIARLRRRAGATASDSTYFLQTPDGDATPRTAQTTTQNAAQSTLSAPGKANTVPRLAAPLLENGLNATEVVPPLYGREIRAKTIPAPSVVSAGPTIAERRAAAAAAAIADAGSERIGGPLKTREPESKSYQPRVVIGDDEEKPQEAAAAPRRAVLPPLLSHALTGIMSALLIFTIFRFSGHNGAAPVARVPLTVVYSSELRPVMELSETKFESGPDGAGIDVVLQPMDARAAMRYVLDAGKTAPDVWIPSEAMWSTRYNEVASGKKRRAISLSAPLALSPLVLVARSDQASALRQQFPARKIDNWDALRTLVATNCVGHFGMTDPKQAGSGALTRFMMARQWCARNRVPWNPAAAADARLWQWMNGFEANVPQYKSSGDMVKDLALGTTGQYWWCLAYESDAIYWIGRGKQVEIFYLPGTYYADHPFCHIERPGATRASAMARVRFEKFLRSPAIQTAMLHNGFRPPEIDLSSKAKNNPFQSKGYADRGLRSNGFEAGGRLDYRTVNGLTAQWVHRYSS